MPCDELRSCTPHAHSVAIPLPGHLLISVTLSQPPRVDLGFAQGVGTAAGAYASARLKGGIAHTRQCVAVGEAPSACAQLRLPGKALKERGPPWCAPFFVALAGRVCL